MFFCPHAAGESGSHPAGRASACIRVLSIITPLTLSHHPRRHPPRGLGGVAVEGDVDVDHVAAEHGIANRPADQPGFPPGDRLANPVDPGCCDRPPGEFLKAGQITHRVQPSRPTRGTRGEMPQVTS